MKSEQKINCFNDIFFSPKHLFSKTYKPYEDIKDTALYVLDTNVLLLPYSVGSKELTEIKKIYSGLLAKKSLFIPVQVVKEFAKNRPQKLGEIYQGLSDFNSKITEYKTPSYQLLKHLDIYVESTKIENDLNKLINAYRKSIKNLMKYVKEINWNDPISQIYSELFSHECVIDNDWDYAELKNELEIRHNFNIPPGFKDKGKDDDGLGDYIIWKDILNLGKETGNSIVFVTGDEKNDWFHQSMGAKLYPRFELVQEYKEHCNDKDFYIISFSQLIEVFGDTNKDEIVKVIKGVERSRNEFKWSVLRKLALGRAQGRCEKCKIDLGSTICELHHIRPIREGGNHDLSNIAVLCKNCHRTVHQTKEEINFISGSPCQMSGQVCPSCKIGVLDVDSEETGVRCPICNLFIPA